MKTRNPLLATATALLQALAANAQSSSSSSQPSCSPTLTASYATPSVAEGYIARLVAQNLTSPRGIKFDSQGALLVVEEGRGISALNLVDSGNDCVSVSGRKLVVDEPTLNHGIETSGDGSVVYGSSGETLWSWEYSPSEQANTSAPTALVTGMAGSDHTSRTLKLSMWVPGMMLINRGSNDNIDPVAANMASGHSQVKAFNISNATEPYEFNTDGVMLGWGLRNDVGIDEEPVTGGIYTVENSADEIERSGQDIHQNNPAEELNFLGYLNGTESSNQGRNFGYPECFTAWQPQDIPDFDGQVGEQFAVPLNSTQNDTTCDLANRQAPRLAFQAHTAPLDILFNSAGTAAWISFHGSWNRDSPIGYDLRVVEFENGEPVAANTSRDAAVPIMSNQDLSACPDGCFRPVGLAWDSNGRLFMSSDSTGEIYMIVRADGNATSSVGSNATGTIPGVTAGNSTRTGSGGETGR
ncbi:hypothetical protein M409DRAFT_62814 [Zasmidium cellare ATCC 36951]|uniref:Pyrroloquinoline quinone-dependent pyranose dehydrogenase beta-propeller domain-containing protein n=1 Tax=Zasmidium cellare ATCC 36951 TaxID=1080233 RepID=A0A6A6D4X0_ZASCE|nr:uncharacterized protein M409DRAFT_62814 [Zasmidium cellare ATCC 36951]KAF2173252.1 hypothetical protein M409DRAFT_62814 [Zasmidium cellare ATCC 36951]